MDYIADYNMATIEWAHNPPAARTLMTVKNSGSTDGDLETGYGARLP